MLNIAEFIVRYDLRNNDTADFDISKVLGVSLVVALLLSNSLLAQESEVAPSGEADAVKGKQLFNQNCAACHALNKKMTGPALAGVSEKYDKEWLYQWIKNSPAMIKDGDADALKIYNEYNQAAITVCGKI